MGVKISIGTAIKRHGWASRDTYIDLIRRGFLRNYPTVGGHRRIDEDELLRLIGGEPSVQYTPTQPTAGEMARQAIRDIRARANT